ncbi:MAG: PAS domain S-box protein [Deltaproteobacteria bacterium]|nr:MAG: PAS domain S-box protein [Deltaproteobacteria bacterium]
MCALDNKTIFQQLPVPAWIEDFSEVRRFLNRLKREQRIGDWKRYLAEHPEVVRQCAELVRIIDVNRETVRLFGARSKKELLANLDKVFTENSFSAFGRELAQMASGATEISTRGENRTLRGETIHLNLKGVIPPGQRRSWKEVLVVSLDVTRETLAEQGLAQNREKLGSFYSSTPIAYQSLDAQGRFLDVNPAFERMLGYHREELVGKPVAELLSEESRQLLTERFPEFLKSGRVDGAEFTMIDHKGHPVEVRVEGRLEKDPERGIIRTHCLLHNISELKQHQQALSRQKRNYQLLYDQFQVLFDGIPDPLFLLTPKLEISWANRGATQATGRSLDLLLGRHCEELHGQCNLPCDTEMVRNCLESGEPTTSLVGTPDERSWGLRAFPIQDPEGRVIQVMVLAHDVTEKIRLQAQTMRTGQLAALGELAAGVAHEINNPINGIINYAQIMVNRAAKEGQTDEIAERILKEGDRIATIVGNLLSFSRDKKEEPRPVRLQDILCEALTLCEARLKKDGISISIDIPSDFPCLLGRHQQLEQVFINLFNNARYALNARFQGTDPNKKLLVSADVDREKGMATVVVEDRGTGIPAHLVNRILNPFFSTKPQNEGTGLGLSICHGIIQEHGGQIDFDSRENDYTRVILTLPLANKS